VASSDTHPELVYPKWMPGAGRYRYCPMCQVDLVQSPDADGIERVACSDCEWVYYPATVLGVNVVPVTEAGELVLILPPGEPHATPAALPGGVVEYGESPEQAAVRETREETGFEVRVVGELGRWFDPDFPYGPMLSFMFEARVLGGTARASHEGDVVVVHPDAMPLISANRKGSLKALEAFLAAAQQRAT
jgi:ADP-ribose pyrophosphatase YjhB (NUDIX family)